MGFEEDLKRRLRKLSDELERGGHDLLPIAPASRRPPKLRKGAAGLGLAACIAAIVALVAQIIPSDRTGTRDTRPAAAPTLKSPEPDTPTPSARPTSKPPPPVASARPSGHYVQASPAPGQDFGCRIPGRPQAPPEGIRIRAELEDPTPTSGSTIRVTARFKNERSTSAHSEQGRPFADFVVYDSSGNLVWSPYPKDAVFTQDLRVRDYAPGEEDSESVQWNVTRCREGGAQGGPMLAPGRYTIRAIWSGNLGGWSDPVSFEIR